MTVWHITESHFDTINAQLPMGVNFGWTDGDPVSAWRYSDSEVMALAGGGIDVNQIVIAHIDQGGLAAIRMNKNLKIYRYIQWAPHDGDLETPPLATNYRNGLTKRLKDKIVDQTAGELRQIDFHDPDSNYDDLIVREVNTWTRDGSDTYTQRDTTITYYDEDGNAHPMQKIILKDYTENGPDMIRASDRRRGNVITKLKYDAMGLLMDVEQISKADAISVGNVFLNDYEAEIQSYLQTPLLRAFQDRLENENELTTSYAWLFKTSNLLPPGVKVWQYLVAELDA